MWPFLLPYEKSILKNLGYNYSSQVSLTGLFSVLSNVYVR
jgi:hypothetical protein